MDFVIGFSILANKKSDNYDLILVIIDRLTKIVYYKPVKVTINIPSLIEVIINVIIHHYGYLKSIIIN